MIYITAEKLKYSHSPMDRLQMRYAHIVVMRMIERTVFTNQLTIYEA